MHRLTLYRPLSQRAPEEELEVARPPQQLLILRMAHALRSRRTRRPASMRLGPALPQREQSLNPFATLSGLRRSLEDCTGRVRGVRAVGSKGLGDGPCDRADEFAVPFREELFDLMGVALEERARDFHFHYELGELRSLV